MMMLHGNGLDAHAGRERFGPAGAVEVGMQIVRDRDGQIAGHGQQPLGIRLEVTDRADRLEIADVTGNQRGAIVGETQRVLQERADCQHRRNRPRQIQDHCDRIVFRLFHKHLIHSAAAPIGIDVLRPARRRAIQSYQRPRPAPLVAETSRISISGLVRRANAEQRSGSNGTNGSRSTLVTSISSAAANILAYFSGLSSPSVTDNSTTRAASPRSKAAGQTRLPTFSMKTTEPSSGASAGKASPTMRASRWQPLPVLICTAGTPVARMRSASKLVS